MKKIKAFTLLETLIVIMVFCVGILVVVHGLSQTLRNKDYANTQIKSAFFAREWIEMIFNLRDANYHKKLPWNCIFTPAEINEENTYDIDENPFCNDYLWSWGLQVLKISMWSGNQYIHVETSGDIQDFTWMFEAYQIYEHTGWLNGTTWFYYDYDQDNGEKTWFARYLLITWVVYDETNSVINKKKLLKIESHVLYQRWALTWEKVMETFIWNYEFKQ